MVVPIVDVSGAISTNVFVQVAGFAGFHIDSVQAASSTFIGHFTQSAAGACGSSNGGTFASAPSTNLCSSGIASSVSGIGPWSWTCLGINGGTSTVCSAAGDAIGPTLSISALADGSITNNSTFNVAGTAYDPDGIAAVTVNNGPVSIAADGSFSAAVPLVAGQNTITTVAVDALGNQTKDVRTVALDQTGPVITVAAPADNAMTAQQTLTVSGSVDKPSTVSVTLNSGAPRQAAMTGTAFTLDVTLAPGLNTISIDATDVATNTTSTKRTVVYDNILPSLAVTDPSQDITTSQSSITVSGTAIDALSSLTVTVAVDGNIFTPALVEGAFSQDLTFSAEGTHTMTVTVTDQLNTSVSVVRNVIYAIPKPQVTINATTSPTRSASQTIGGTVDAGAAVTVTCPSATVGQVTYPTTTTWQATLTGMTIGTNVITVTATSDLGKPSDPAFASITVQSPMPTGDVDGSGYVEMADILTAYLAVLGRVQLTDAERKNADVAPLGPDGKPQGNGVVDIADIVLLLRHIVGLANW